MLEEDGRNHTDRMINMVLVPVRCFTCGAPLGHLWEKFYERVKNGEDPEKVLDDLGVKRYCCRRMLVSHVQLIEELVHYSRPV